MDRPTDPRPTRPVPAPAATAAVVVEQAPRPRLGLSTAQVAGGALAATTSALAASEFGVGGTLVGAAVGSVISSVGGAVYARSLQNVSERTRTVITRGRALPSSTRPDALPALADAAPDDQLPADQLPADQLPTASDRAAAAGGRWGWRPVTVMGAGAFVLALGGITASELVLGHPVSSASERGTTLTRVVEGGSSGTPAPTPSTGPSTPATTGPTGTPSGSATPSQTPTDSGSATGEGTPSGAATPSGTPSDVPTGSPTGSTTGGSTDVPGPAGSGAATVPTP